MNINELLSNPPKVHDWDSGALTSSGLPELTFRFMDKVLTQQTRSVETGMGISTALFAMKGCKHTCINPDSDEIQRLKDYCSSNNVSCDNMTFLAKRSDEVWFELKDKAWDFVLIDGCHGFPIPFMDWYFLTEGLTVGGHLVIDDTQIITGGMLKDFLLTEDAWKLVEPFSKKTAVFQKVAAFNFNKEWMRQPYVLNRTQDLEKATQPLPMDFVSRAKRKIIKMLS